MTTTKDPKPWNMGPLSPSKPGRHFVQPKSDFPEPSQVCNSMSKEPLQLSRLWSSPARPGSDHSHLGSKGGC